jgi:hypothetical protein
MLCSLAGISQGYRCLLHHLAVHCRCADGGPSAGAISLLGLHGPPVWYIHGMDFDTLYCAGALTVGLGAGAISTLGFAFLTPFLERTIGLGDTCVPLPLHTLSSRLLSSRQQHNVPLDVTSSSVRCVQERGMCCCGVLSVSETTVLQDMTCMTVQTTVSLTCSVAVQVWCPQPARHARCTSSCHCVAPADALTFAWQLHARLAETKHSIVCLLCMLKQSERNASPSANPLHAGLCIGAAPAGIIGGLVAAFASLGQAQAKLSYGHGAQFGYQASAPPCSTCCSYLLPDCPLTASSERAIRTAGPGSVTGSFHRATADCIDRVHSRDCNPDGVHRRLDRVDRQPCRAPAVVRTAV